MSRPHSIAFKPGEGTPIRNQMAPRLLPLSELLRATPSLPHVLALMQEGGADSSIGKGFVHIQFCGSGLHAGPAEVAKAEYVSRAINLARPNGMFEQVASQRGASVAVDLAQLARMRRGLEAQMLLGDTSETLRDRLAEQIVCIQEIEAIVDRRKAQQAPLYEGFDDAPRRGPRARAVSGALA